MPHIATIACVLGLALVVLVIWRGRKSPLAPSLALLALNITAWNFADDVWAAAGKPPLHPWHLLDHASAPLTVPLALWFVLVFLGQQQELRWVIRASWVYALALGLPCLLPALHLSDPIGAWASEYVDSPAYYTGNLIHLLLVAPLGVGLLFEHALGVTEERRRHALQVLVGIVLLAAAGFTEYIPGQGMGLAGYVAFTLIFTILVLRPRFDFGDLDRPARFYPVAVLTGVAGVTLWTWAARTWAAPALLIWLGTMSILVVVLFGLIRYSRRLEVRQRVEQQAYLGKYSSQLAHNLKDPITVMSASIQYLQRQLRSGRSIADQAALLERLEAQVRRMDAVVNEYRRLGRTEARREPIELNALVTEVVTGQSSAADPERVVFRTELADALPTVNSDPELLRQALENLCRNATEAMPAGGTVTVYTGWADARHLFTAVKDTGEGMDARTKAKVREGFYTSKSGGTGLGLDFVRRVAQAHGGEMTIESDPGRGTTVTVVLALQ
jgi:two-component system, NtrC family, sensor histidine kinase HydH